MSTATQIQKGLPFFLPMKRVNLPFHKAVLNTKLSTDVTTEPASLLCREPRPWVGPEMSSNAMPFVELIPKVSADGAWCLALG